MLERIVVVPYSQCDLFTLPTPNIRCTSNRMCPNYKSLTCTASVTHMPPPLTTLLLSRSHDLVRCCKSTSLLKTDFPSFCFADETFLILPLLYFLPVTNEMINVVSLLRYLSIHFSVFLVESAKEHRSGRCLARLGQLYWHHICFVSLPAVGRFLSCNK
jgi:hypothetical protein